MIHVFSLMPITDRLHQPEYTGENRCIPCTTINVAIAVVASALAAVTSTVLGASLFTLSLGTIYFRGYLIPGTPTLTKRYFPDRVLRWFDKDTTMPMTDETVEIDPEQVLLDANAIEICQNGANLCLTGKFQQAWREHIHTVRTRDLDEKHLEDALDASKIADQITFDQQGNAFVAYTDDSVIGQWSSQAILVADVAAAAELSERYAGWVNLSPAETARVLMSLHIFIEQCPNCDGHVQVKQEVVESCCRSYDVVASACQNCDARLFEIEWDDTDTDKSVTQPNQSIQASA